MTSKDHLSVPDVAISGPLSIVASAWRIADDHGLALARLPIVGVGLGQAMGASPLSVLLGGGLGGILLVIGTALVCGGLLWTDAITDKVCR